MTTIQKYHKFFTFVLVMAFVFVSLFCICATFTGDDQAEKPFRNRTQIAESVLVTSDILNPFFSGSQSEQDISKLSNLKNSLSYSDKEELQLHMAMNLRNFFAVLSLIVILFSFITISYIHKQNEISGDVGISFLH